MLWAVIGGKSSAAQGTVGAHLGVSYLMATFDAAVELKVQIVGHHDLGWYEPCSDAKSQGTALLHRFEC